jgi:hypothetical protein
MRAASLRRPTACGSRDTQQDTGPAAVLLTDGAGTDGTREAKATILALFHRELAATVSWR